MFSNESGSFSFISVVFVHIQEADCCMTVPHMFIAHQDDKNGDDKKISGHFQTSVAPPSPPRFPPNRADESKNHVLFSPCLVACL